MNLRQNPKRKSIQDIGTAKIYRKYTDKSRNSIKYVKRIEKEAAIEANMVKLLTIVKNDNPAIHLQFWQENLRSDYPVIEIRRSNLINGGFGVFVTDNCYFLPIGLMFIPNCIEAPHNEPAEKDTIMSHYQFAVFDGNKKSYIFPTLEPNPKLPCAQFINTPLRKTQGEYSNGICDGCVQAMHLGNARLLGRYPGGFKSHRIIYPGFEVLGTYMSSHRLPIIKDYYQRRTSYEKNWKDATQEASRKERLCIQEIKEQFKDQITYWRKYASKIHFKLLTDDAIINTNDFDKTPNDLYDEDFEL